MRNLRRVKPSDGIKNMKGRGMAAGASREVFEI